MSWRHKCFKKISGDVSFEDNHIHDTIIIILWLFELFDKMYCDAGFLTVPVCILIGLRKG